MVIRERYGARQIPAEGVDCYGIVGAEMSQKVPDGIANIRKGAVHAVACIEQDEHVGSGGGLTAGQKLNDWLVALGKRDELLRDSVFENANVGWLKPTYRRAL